MSSYRRSDLPAGDATEGSCLTRVIKNAVSVVASSHPLRLFTLSSNLPTNFAPFSLALSMQAVGASVGVAAAIVALTFKSPAASE